MSEIPPLTPGQEPLPESLPRHRHRLQKTLWGLGLGLGSTLVVGGVMFYVWGNRLVTSLLLPRVADTLNDSIQRPVELGDVEGFSFWGVRLGKTVIPPTDTDSSSITVDAIEIKIGLRSLIFQRVLKSKIILISPEVSLIENEDGQWLELSLPEPSEAERPVELEIESIEVRNASLNALPYTTETSEAVVPRELIQIEDLDGRVAFFGDSAQEAEFRLKGNVIAEAPEGDGKNRPALGRFTLQGDANLETQTGKINARVKDLPSIGANLLLPDSLGIRSGKLDGNFTVAADLDEGRLDQSSLDVTGKAQFRDGELVASALASPIQNIRSQLVFRGQQVSIEDTSLQLNETVLLAEGDVGVEEGYDLTARIPSISVAEVEALADVEVPITADGTFILTTEVTGPLEQPRIKGRLASLEPLRIDKVGVESAVADFSTTLPDFELADFKLDEFRARPTTGGLIVANGQADLSDLENLTFQLEGNASLPTDEIAKTYGLSTPPGIALGTLNADFEVAGDLESQNAAADWRLSRGLVSAIGRAEVTDFQAPLFQLSGRATAPVDVVARAYDVALPAGIALGSLSASFAVDGNPENQTASADWRLARGLISASGQASARDLLQRPSFQLSGRATAPVERVAQAYDVNLPEGIVLGRFSADFSADGDLETQTAFADWQLSDGLISASGQAGAQDLLQQLSFQLSGQATAPADVIAQAYDANLPADVALGRLSTDFSADGNLETQTAFADWRLSQGSFFGQGDISLIDQIVSVENARLSTAQGTAAAAARLNLATQNWRATAETDQIAVDQFTTLASGLLSADLAASGSLGALNLDQIQASGNAVIADARVQLPDATLPLLETGDWTTAFEWRGDRIAVNRFSAPGLQANGIIGVDFAREIPIGDLALKVALESYDLERVNSFLPDSVSQYARLDGFTSFNGQLLGTLENPQLSGNAQLDSLAVNELEFETLSGPVDFALADGGQVNLQGQQDQLQLVAVGAPQKAVPFWPVSFAVRNQDFVARGSTQGDILQAEVVQLPLERLAIAPAPEYGLGLLTGLLQADITANLADFSNPILAGTVSVTDPSLSPVDAEQLNAEFSYADGTATLNRGELLLAQSQYLLSGSAKVKGDLEYQGQLAIAQGRIEDLVPIVQALDLSAFGLDAAQPDPGLAPTGSAADLDLTPRGLSGGTLLDKLENFVAFVEANPAAAAMAEGETDAAARSLASTDLPPLDQLAGEFTGNIAFAGSSLTVADARVDFNIQGDSWEWGENTPANEFALRGEVAQSKIDIETVFIKAGKTQVNLVANGNLDQLNGRLVVNNLPVALAQLIYPLPIEVEGDLNLATTFGGSLANPAIEGKLAIAAPQVNNYLLAGLTTDFKYRNALLAANATVAVSEQARPIAVKGRVPYALPFANVSPATDQLAVTAVVPNGNLEIINALTDETVQWQSGQGEAVIEVGGTLSQPTVAGRASFRDGTVSSRLLADDVTNLSGDVLFNLEQVAVQQLQAQINDGRISVNGQLPLLPSKESILAQLTPGFKLNDFTQLLAQQPPASASRGAGALTVVLENLPIDYSDLVSGVFDGQLLVTGAALTPTVTGSIEIDNGLVNATNVLQQADSLNIDSAEVEAGSVAEAINTYQADYLNSDQPELALKKPEGVLGSILENVAIRDLAVRLGNRLTIAARPVFRITALGDLTVNGTLADIQPLGTIELQTGEVNLFASQFRLDRRAPNTAEFTPGSGLDPELNVELLARVQDADINTLAPLSSGFSNAEVSDTAIDTAGEVKFIRVKASAQGRASEITDNLTLSSRPALDEKELLTLLSSSTVTGLANASLTQLGGFLGGGGRLSALGDRVADAVGLQSFRIFPTTDTSDDGAGFGIGVEASAAIGDRFNVTFLEILNNSDPPQLGVFYRVTDDLNVRGASNLGNTELEIEYQLRF